MRAFFDAVFARIGEEKRSSSLIVGDSLTSDIQGGNNAGIDTVWYNPRGEKNQLGVRITHEIADLRELYTVLNIQ